MPGCFKRSRRSDTMPRGRLSSKECTPASSTPPRRSSVTSWPWRASLDDPTKLRALVAAAVPGVGGQMSDRRVAETAGWLRAKFSSKSPEQLDPRATGDSFCRSSSLAVAQVAPSESHRHRRSLRHEVAAAAFTRSPVARVRSRRPSSRRRGCVACGRGWGAKPESDRVRTGR